MAEGAGSWFRPYELNLSDPVLLGAAQCQGLSGPVGSQSIFSLVCAWDLKRLA